MISGIAHVCIEARELEASEAFYRALGLERKFAFRRGEEVIGFYLDCGRGTFVEVFHADARPAGPSPLRHVCLEVEGLDALLERLRAAGIDAGDKTMGCDGSWQAWLTDPDGVAIELHEYTPRSAQRTGADCEVDW